MSRIRVALITHEFAIRGGSVTMTRFLYRVLDESGIFEPRIISLATSARDRASVRLAKPASWLQGPIVMDLEDGGLPYSHAGALFPELETQRHASRGALRRLLKDFRILQFVVGVPSWACAAGDRLPETLVWFATTVRNDRASRMESATGLRYVNHKVMNLAAEASERKALKNARSLIGLSNYSVDQVKALVPQDRLRMIPFGVDTELFHPCNAGPGGYILCVGRHSDPRKNVRMLVEAYDAAVALDARLPDLCIVGESPPDAVMAWISRSRIASRVRVLGWAQGEELAELYRRSMMLVVSSDEEGLGIVILEAMASGVPVVSTRCGGPETAVVDGVTGYLTPTGDANALRDAMLRVAGDSRLRNLLAEAGLTRARELFSLKAAGGQFLDLYSGIPSLAR